MKRDLVLRDLHMGCGEGLVGRVRRVPAEHPPAPVPVVRRDPAAEQPAGKGKR